MISNGCGKKHEDEFPECIIKAFYHITPAVFLFFSFTWETTSRLVNKVGCSSFLSMDTI